ncbi:ATP12 family protein [uncultured Tateyamaria sp.]|uniref:ATP12 family chaperone protein n=1 Tax=Tateyamaria sp. 1078 TaxID=3417464 RepID=UPI00260E1C44|nr:ATP12 family protein [uncultured Tateyamaria sp.]
MSEWKQKRFWTNAEAVADGSGWTIELDGRRVKTPAKAALHLPTQSLAQAIAAEWAAQEDVVDPLSMPFTRSANAAIDKVAIQKAEVADMLAAYGDADLLCYRADQPKELVDRQAAVWDAYLNWAAENLGARLAPRTGLMHESQDPAALTILSETTHAMSPFALAAFHDLVSLSGSWVLGFAAAKDMTTLPEIWAASRLDEIWQAEQWGDDEEALELAKLRETAFFHAKSFWNAAEGDVA